MADSQSSTAYNTPMPSTRSSAAIFTTVAAEQQGAAATAAVGTSMPGNVPGMVPEGKVVVWDGTMKQFVVKNIDDVKLETWRSRLRRAAFKFSAGGPLA